MHGFTLHALDAEVGRVDEILFDDQYWTVRYLIVHTGDWLTGRKVLISPLWASSVSWEEGAVHVDMSRQSIRESPEWDPSASVNREYESCLCDFYGRPI